MSVIGPTRDHTQRCTARARTIIHDRHTRSIPALGHDPVENAGLRGGRELSRAGARDLPMGLDALTGYTVVNAESLEDAERLAQGNPYISSIRMYEIASY